MCVGLDVFFWVLIINSYQNYIFGGGGMGDKSMFLGFLHIHWWKGGEGRLNNCLLLYIPLFSNKNDNIHKTKCKNETYLKNVIKNISNYRVASLLKTERDRLEKKIYKVFLPRRAIKGARRVGDPCRMQKKRWIFKDK